MVVVVKDRIQEIKKSTIMQKQKRESRVKREEENIERQKRKGMNKIDLMNVNYIYFINCFLRVNNPFGNVITKFVTMTLSSLFFQIVYPLSKSCYKYADDSYGAVGQGGMKILTVTVKSANF